MTDHHLSTLKPQPFRTADILWAIGIWAIILGLTPVIAFHLLIVN